MESIRRGRWIRAPREPTTLDESPPPSSATSEDEVPAAKPTPGALALAVAGARSKLLERHLDDVVDLARMLAERWVRTALPTDDDALRSWALGLIDEARGASRIRVLAHPSTADSLARLFENHEFGEREIEISGDPELAPDALLLETDVGIIRASTGDGIERLARTLRDALVAEALSSEHR